MFSLSSDNDTVTEISAARNWGEMGKINRGKPDVFRTKVTLLEILSRFLAGICGHHLGDAYTQSFETEGFVHDEVNAVGK